MAEALRQWAASVMRSNRPKPLLSPTIYIKLLEKVEEMKKAGVPPGETSKLLRGMESRFKAFRMLAEINQRQVQGLLRNRLDRRVQTIIITVGSPVLLLELCKLADMSIELYERIGK